MVKEFIMKTQAEKQHGKATESASNGQSEFNFELWAKQVRPQLLASVQKRGAR